MKLYQYKDRPELYRFLGIAKPAGELRRQSYPMVVVYQDIELYYRNYDDFKSQMTAVTLATINKV